MGASSPKLGPAGMSSTGLTAQDGVVDQSRALGVFSRVDAISYCAQQGQGTCKHPRKLHSHTA